VKLLVVTYAYRPAPNPRAFRWAAIAEHWVRKGHSVDVVCAPAPGREGPSVLAGVRVHTTAGRLTAPLRRTFGLRERRDRGADANGPAPARAALSHWSTVARDPVLRRLYDATWKQLYWPDYACAWYPAARRMVLRLLAGGRYDAMVTVSVPFTGHLVGHAARKRHPELPWVVDIGDPFSFVEGAPPNNQRLYRRLNVEAERRVFTAADAIAVTTEGTRREYATLHPENAAKVTVIPPLLSLPARGAADGPRIFSGGDGRLRLVFVGTFYRAIRSPEFLLSLFRSLLETELGPRLELHLVGSTHDCDDLIARHRDLLGRSLFVHGVVDREAARAAMSEADVLINVGNENSYQLPSKVVEYVSTGRPILNLIAGEDDSSHAFLASFEGCLAISTAALPSAERLGALVDFLRSPPRPRRDAVARSIAPFRTEAIADAYEALIARAARPANGLHRSTTPEAA
jgi:hypothetical protein